jgi:hypothetical protein
MRPSSGYDDKNVAGGFRRSSVFARFALIPAAVLLANSSVAATAADLYSATVIVTGRDNLAERARGIREALPLVLVKVSANAAVGVKTAEEGYTARAEPLVEKLYYLDRKEGIQISDEQGTRERSFELTVHFDPDGIDALLRLLGSTPWGDPRPEIGVTLDIVDGVSSYRLTRSSDLGYGQRAALEDEALALGLDVRLPDAAGAELNSPVRLAGRMIVRPEGYWNTAWVLIGPHLEERFAFDGITFDQAFRKALTRSAGALANKQ